MPRLIHNILHAGIYPDIDETEKRQVGLLNNLIIIATIPTVVFGVLDLILGHYEMLWSVAVLVVAWWAENRLVVNRRYALAKHLTFNVFLVAVSFVAIIVGGQTGAEAMLFALVVIPWLIFKSKSASIFYFLLTIAVYGVVFWAQKTFDPLIILEDHLLEPYSIIVGITVMLIIFLFTGYSRDLNDMYARKINEQKEQVSLALEELTDSINYAKRLQSSILPDKGILKEYCRDSFVLYKPKDIVAGDFYWIESLPESSSTEGTYIAAADCTGHGVPGAMVSVVCSNALTKAVIEEDITDPAEILNRTRDLVKTQFQHSQEDIRDGMDISLIKLTYKGGSFSEEISGIQVSYAGANNPLWVVKNNDPESILEIKADKQPVGRHRKEMPFTSHDLDLLPGDMLYLFSDGFPDQFGGPKGKKFKAANFKKLLLSIQDKPMEEQKEILDDEFEKWRGDLEQIDDVCVIGVRL